jgi:hypothetical protein
MPMYRAKTLCFVANSIRKAGDEFEYNGPENTNLEPLDAPKAKAKEVPAQTEESSAERKWTPKAARASKAGADKGEA